MKYTELFEHIYQSYDGIEDRVNALDVATLRAWTVIKNLLDRGGFDHWFESIDPETQDEIFDEMRDAISGDPHAK
jgi:hypothetical protein